MSNFDVLQMKVQDIVGEMEWREEAAPLFSFCELLNRAQLASVSDLPQPFSRFLRQNLSVLSERARIRRRLLSQRFGIDSTLSESPKSPFWETSKWGPYFSVSELNSSVMTFSVFGVVFFNWASLSVVSYWVVTLLHFVVLWWLGFRC